ncbi:MAG: efflux RND transporter periplasmic adaptor subunit [Nitrospirae bacterium]|jgi:RND family efflux transporter MFP subunit|nr:efflux RND transporter periplasmic adaptor subunit [Nitrospirota bacterium]
MWKKMTALFPILIALFSIILFSGCDKKDRRVQIEKIINIHALKVEKKQLKPYIESVGTLYPDEEVVVSAEIEGILKNVRGDEGAPVYKGQTLAVIDDIDYELDVKRTEALLKQAEATLANTKLEYQRKESLYKEQLVTEQQFDDVKTRLSLAEADVDKAKATLMLSRQKHLKTKILSPLTGVIKTKHIEKGNLVKNGSPLFTLIRNNPLKMSFTITEKDLSKLKPGQQVKLRVDAYPDKEFEGILNIIYPSLDERTRSLRAEAKIPNNNGLLKPGLFAHVILYTGAPKDTIVIPSTSLLYEGESIKVFVVEGEVAKERPVKIGQKYKIETSTDTKRKDTVEYTEIMEGLKENELVVTVGQQGLYDGAKVKIVEQ